MLTSLLLSYPDSNQDKQNQNLLCYHYTIGQSSLLSFEERCKGSVFERKCQTFRVVFDCSAVWKVLSGRLLDTSGLLYNLHPRKLFTHMITLVTSLSLIAGWHGRLSSVHASSSATGRTSVLASL